MRKKKLKQMYEATIAQYTQTCKEYKEICDDYSRKFEALVRKEEESSRLAALGELCGRWISLHNPKYSATLYLEEGKLRIVISKGKTAIHSQLLQESVQGLGISYSGARVMLPVKFYRELGGLLVGELGMFLRDNDTAFNTPQDE